MNEELIKRARQAYNNKDYDKAILLMEKVYLNQKNFHNNYYLFTFLKKGQEWRQAVNVANEYLIDYIQNDDYFYQYFDCLLHSGNILGSFELLNKLNSYLNSTEKGILERKLKQYPSYLNKKQQQLKQETLRKLKYLGAYSVQEQRRVLKDIKYFNPQELFLNSKSALLDKDVPCVVRMSLLNTLRTVSNNQVVVLNLFEEQITVDLSTLSPIEEMSIYQVIKHQIFDSKQISESLKLKMFSEAKLKLFVIYPEIENLDQDELLKIILTKSEKLSGKEQILNHKINEEINKINDFKI